VDVVAVARGDKASEEAMERLGGGNDLVDNANELLVEEREGSENAEDEGEEVRSGLRERVALGLIGRLPGRKDLVDRGRDILVVLLY
jgi:hypothetical protein